MIKRILFFGDVKEPGICAQKHYPESTLLTKNNLTDYFDQTNKHLIYHTSLADLPRDQTIIWKVLDHADTIIFCPPDDKWSDNKHLDRYDVTSTIQGYTEFLLYVINQNKQNVKNLNLDHYISDEYISLKDHRQTQDNQLWICGCSVSHGYGVSESERFGYLLGNSLGLPVSWLTCPGSSIPWAADQLLRSDLRRDDIVIWGLTSENRCTYIYEDESLAHVTPFTAKFIDYNKLDVSHDTIKQTLNSRQMSYQAILSVQQVSRFCRIIGAKLLIIGLACSKELTMRLGTLKNFYPYYNPNSIDQFVDLGTDLLHPGPAQHALYHEFIQSKLKHLT